LLHVHGLVSIHYSRVEAACAAGTLIAKFVFGHMLDRGAPLGLDIEPPSTKALPNFINHGGLDLMGQANLPAAHRIGFCSKWRQPDGDRVGALAGQGSGTGVRACGSQPLVFICECVLSTPQGLQSDGCQLACLDSLNVMICRQERDPHKEPFFRGDGSISPFLQISVNNDRPT
jgi:hypothetical protein